MPVAGAVKMKVFSRFMMIICFTHLLKRENILRDRALFSCHGSPNYLGAKTIRG